MATIREFQSNLPSMIAAGVSVRVESSPGMGKSSVVEQFVKSHDPDEFGYQIVNLASHDAVDLMGFQYKGERSWPDYNGGAPVTVTDPSMPLWFVDMRTGRPLNTFKQAILFLDEFGQGSIETKRAAATLIHERRVGPWQLNKSVFIIAASNRTSDRSGVTKDLDFLINRQIIIPIEPDLDSWKEWAFTAGVHHLGVSFADQYPQVVFSDGVPDEQGPWCTPRSLVNCMTALQAYGAALSMDSEKLPVDGWATMLCNGAIGSAAAAQFISHTRLGNEMPSFDDIINAPETTPIPAAVDAQMLVTHKLAAMVTLKTVDPTLKYMQRMPEEFALVFARSAVRRENRLLSAPPFLKWIEKNSGLISAIQAMA